MSLADLKHGGLYVILFIRHDPPVQDNFHWGLYLHDSESNGGTKYHIVKPGSGWITDHGNTLGVFKSFLLVGLFRIADVPAGWEGYVDQTIRSLDNRVNTPDITCKIWVFWVLELLKRESNGYTVLKCNDLPALEREIKNWGNAKAAGAAANEQPRSLTASRICGL
ncbi:hypothetical protein VTL71DRAFT_9554 [Oculimacula yallundae]|uniref:Ubiquitin-like protease family profile domain-containing protein n=1 Tax=Oculimacula yallundae TaxID=86028 RepID=A0ABR4BR48_9HELO